MATTPSRPSSSMSTPNKKTPFKPASAYPSTPSSTNQSPGNLYSTPTITQITPPKTKIPTIIRQSSNNPGSASPLTSNAIQTTSIHNVPSFIRNSPSLLTKKNNPDKRLAGEINAARSFLKEESNVTSANNLMNQADRRNKLKKRLLIQQTEKIKELLWEKASLLQKKQLLEDETRELETLKHKIEEEREERQRRWVMEEAIRREEEEEELKYSLMRMKKYQQRYEFEVAKREKMIRNKEMKDKKKGNYQAELIEQQKRREEERKQVIAGIEGELDITLSDAAVGTGESITSISTINSSQLQPHINTAINTGSTSPHSPSSSGSNFPSDGISRRISVGGQSTSSINESDVAKELTAGGFSNSPQGTDTPTAVSINTNTNNKNSNESIKSPPSQLTDDHDDLDIDDDSIPNAATVDDEDDVTFISSDDDDENEQKESFTASRRNSVGKKDKEEKEQQEAQRERDREIRAQETLKEREERERREAEDREKREKREAEERIAKEKEWEELKLKLLAEARELQETERRRQQQQRDEEAKKAALSIAAKEAEMNEIIAKLKEAEIKAAQPTTPSHNNPTSALSPTSSTNTSPSNSTPVTPSHSSSSGVDASALKALPALSSISLRSATASLAARKDEEVDEPKQAPGTLNPLPSLSATPVRRLVPVPVVTEKKKPREQSESMAISSMLHELEAIEEDEEMMLKMGIDVTKLPRTGKPKVVKLYIDKNLDDDWIIRWDSKKKNKDSAAMILYQCKIIIGISSGLFQKPENQEKFNNKRNCCFSLVNADRSLDVCCMTFSDQDLWTRTLQRLAKKKRKGGMTASTMNSAANSIANSTVNSVANTPKQGNSTVPSTAVSPIHSRRGSSNMPLTPNTDNSKDIEQYLQKHLKNF